MSKLDLTIVALAWNEIEHLPRCFASLQNLIRQASASTLVLVDPAGDPKTVEVAHRLADRVETRPFQNFSTQRNYALDLVTTRWVFFIDPDERLTEESARAIISALEAGEHYAYRVARRNIFFGREVRHTGWYPDYQVRLLDRTRCRYDEEQAVHEVPVVRGTIGILGAPLIHFNYASWRQFYTKQLAYADLHARALFSAGQRARPRSLVGQPLRELKRRLIDYKGYKDGGLGIALSFAMSAYTFVTYVKLLRAQKRCGGG